MPTNFQRRFELLPVIFLDFDGVMHPTSATPEKFFSCASILADAIGDAECEIIISSSWRHHHTLDEIIGMLPETLQHLVQGTTGEAFIGRYPRYNEILTYANNNGLGSDWRALDDSWIEFPPNCSKLIQCNPNIGLGRKQADYLHKWLS